MSTQTYTGTLVVQDCCNCGMTFGVERSFDKARHSDKGTFYCPAGHPQLYVGQSDAQALKEQTVARQQAESQRDAARSLAARESERRLTAERQRAAARGQVTKIKRRVGRGVCPCCNRTFADLQRHMAGQHPDFADVEATP